jgi:hypothetical protein
MSDSHRNTRLARSTTFVYESPRSAADFALWGLALLRSSGYADECGFHVVDWAHDDWCPLHPDNRSADAPNRCHCQPDATLVLHVGTPYERRIEVVREGVPLTRGSHA